MKPFEQPVLITYIWYIHSLPIPARSKPSTPSTAMPTSPTKLQGPRTAQRVLGALGMLGIGFRSQSQSLMGIWALVAFGSWPFAFPSAAWQMSPETRPWHGQCFLQGPKSPSTSPRTNSKQSFRFPRLTLYSFGYVLRSLESPVTATCCTVKTRTFRRPMRRPGLIREPGEYSVMMPPPPNKRAKLFVLCFLDFLLTRRAGFSFRVQFKSRVKNGVCRKVSGTEILPCRPPRPPP